ncbi:hypothetical protein AB4Y89_02675 [Terriglobus sp. 2YAB30_2]|uniref:hypothetical protein n=1 Tax=unclassified Terriglobus TaxID=2628988 RepID=UPI003F95090C
MNSHPKLEFLVEFDDYTAWEVEQKGWFGACVLRFPDGSSLPVTFFDPVRLQQEIDFTFKQGATCFSEAGLIVIPTVTKENMLTAIESLNATNDFVGMVRSIL